MAHADGIITAPVRLLQDLQPMLGVSGDVGYVISRGNYNKWAKYKHVPLDSPYTAGISNWWKGNNGLCGISVPQFNNISAAYADETAYTLDNDNSPWYRMLDFNGYNENCIRPYILRIPVKLVKSTTSHTYVRLSLPTVASDNLAFWDVFGGKYLGVIMHRTGATGVDDYRAIANVRITDAMTSTVDIQIDNCGGDVLTGSMVDIAVIVASELTETWSTYLNGTIYTLNDEAAYSVRKNVPVYQERESTYAISVLLGGVRPTQYFTIGNATVGGGNITATATWLASPSALAKTYNLTSIIARATDLYDGSVLAEQTFDYQSGADLPPYIDDTMRVDRVPFTLRTALKQLHDIDGQIITNAAFSYQFNFE